jgi:hypothetical protein
MKYHLDKNYQQKGDQNDRRKDHGSHHHNNNEYCGSDMLVIIVKGNPKKSDNKVLIMYSLSIFGVSVLFSAILS